MNGTGQSPVDDTPWVFFDLLIPGCRWRVVAPYDLPIEAGIRAELARLEDRRWLVVTRVHSLDWDGIDDDIRFDMGFDNEDDALLRARVVLAEMTASARETMSGAECSRLEQTDWPLRDEVAGQPVLRAGETVYFHDHARWRRAWIDAAVLPIDPATPFTGAMMEAIDPGRDVLRYFRKIGESLGVHAYPPKAAPAPSAPITPATVPVPHSRLRFFIYWQLLPWLAATALGVLLVIVERPEIIWDFFHRDEGTIIEQPRT